MTETKTPFGRAMALAAVSGLRAALGPAFLETSRSSPKAGNWVLGALGEMALSKTGVLPRGYRPVMLIPHAAAGAWVARESMRKDGMDDEPSTAIAGAIVAAGVASVAPIARIALTRGLGVSGMLLGLAEDYLALKIGGEATDMSFAQIGEATRSAVEDLRDRVAPDLDVPMLPNPGRPSPSHA
jgi:hypothetical protein